MSRILTVLLLGTLLTFTACGSDASTDADAMEGVTTAGFFNTMCPIMGEAIDAEEDGVTYKGQSIGFCCGKCSGKFDAMSDPDKVAALAKVGTKLP